MRQQATPRLIVAGGGTGGHVFAGLALIEAWRAANGTDVPVLFVGAHGGIEERLVPRAGVPLKLLRIGALNRVSWLKRFKTLLELPVALLVSALWVLRFRPCCHWSWRVCLGPMLGSRNIGRMLFGTRTAILSKTPSRGYQPAPGRMGGFGFRRIYAEVRNI